MALIDIRYKYSPEGTAEERERERESERASNQQAEASGFVVSVFCSPLLL